MNVTTAAVSFDDGAVGIELSDGAAAVPEQGSLGLPAEGLRPPAPSGPSPPKLAVWIFLSENLYMRYRVFMSLQRSRRVWRRATGSSSPGRRQKIWKEVFSVCVDCNPLKSHKTAKGFWKSLEKTGGILEKLGGSRGAAGASAVTRSNNGNAARGPRPIANSPRALSPFVGESANFYL